MPAPPTNDPNLILLRKSIASGNCVAFIGAGVSMPACPSWTHLIDTLVTRCGISPELAPPDDRLLIAELARKTKNAEYCGVLKEFFPSRYESSVYSRYHLLSRINFYSYITTNFDPHLIDVFALHRDIEYCAYPYLPTEHHHSKGLYYLHGCLHGVRNDSDVSVVLGKDEFEKAYDFGKSLLPAFLQSIFTTHDVCFLGCSLQDEYILRVVKLCEEFKVMLYGLSEPDPPTWFAFMEAGIGKAEASEWEQTYGIKTVRYAAADPTHPELTSLLRHLAGARDPVLRKPADRKKISLVETEVPR